MRKEPKIKLNCKDCTYESFEDDTEIKIASCKKHNRKRTTKENNCKKIVAN